MRRRQARDSARMLPFVILGARRRLDALGAAIATGVLLVAVAFVAFGTQAADFINVLGTQQRLDSGTSVIAQLGSWFGWTGNPTGARVVASVLFGLLLVYLIARAWRRPRDWLECAGWSTVALMVSTTVVLTPAFAAPRVVLPTVFPTPFAVEPTVLPAVLAAPPTTPPAALPNLLRL